MAPPIPIAVNGAAGRMGQRLLTLAEEDPALRPVAGFDIESPVTAAALREVNARALIDFSHADALEASAKAAAGAGAALILGTTGLDASHDGAIDAAAARVPVVAASNFSVVVNVLHHLAAEAVRLLQPDAAPGWDVEVMEMHHRYKKDAPSGTALALARTLAAAAGRDRSCIRLERHGDEATRDPGEITVQTLRVGDHPGEHTILLGAPGERLELKHVSTSRDSYATGALRAAAWAAGRPPGRYAIAEALGIG
ncbi:4-hydroxy-tetrahydrodipicolinate reductase [Phycisphaera mikurensis]|uniref:4-hydroxy-tetrahydrodipicolinate reductase n=1 Tax=Phycisphaera mikurensis (strain NBRC 102666 / KCTC 22515 / FYK2301M01) TaxID=1142394 RepID=I0IAM1_PHYMF|nr:4-hydroxy-tetrahydrodipicolinate reductase [Phycisphaera mikurensis]MBB6441695.1 4-hydroxy-tetrahydrodipicolinate reductase [Phycisphaera mikurensis]BAM02309.1 dihydrodipicolinate reductase [Phycisphaera mikurensis NBRC 102666]